MPSAARALVCVCALGVACTADPDPEKDPNVSVPNYTPTTVTAHGMCNVSDDPTRCHFDHEGCGVGDRQTACQKGKSLAFPDCAPTAQVAGTASRSQDVDQGGDGDFVFDIMPSLQSVILDPAPTPPRLLPRELRNAASFDIQGGSVHVEVQSCRYCRGAWIFPEQPGVVFDGEIHDGDIVAASGNWVADMPQHEGWAELHEATAIALVHPVGAGTAYILVNAFFVEAPEQRDDLVLDVPVPPPEVMTATVTVQRLRCDVDPKVQQRGCPCATPFGVNVRATPDEATSRCRLQIHRGVAAPPPLPFNCVNTPPCFGGQFEPSPDTCANIFFGGVVRASWD
jgi:hypothetical protein